MKKTILFLFSSWTIACSSGPAIKQTSVKKIKLDFTKCLVEDKGYNYLSISIPKGFKKKWEQSHGFCEYQFHYRDAVFYVSTDIYSGSRINIQNRFEIGIDTYARSRSLEPVDTIKEGGIQTDGRYWEEQILGSYVVGYANASATQVESFKRTINSVTKE